MSESRGIAIRVGRRGRLLWLRGDAAIRMNGESKEKRREAGTGTAPHPVLKKYYERESDRRPFVSALFDKGAAHYDWICGLG